MESRSHAVAPIPASAGQSARRDRAAWHVADVPWGGDLASAEAFCRTVAARHYENFPVASRLVPRRLRQHLANVYAFARWSDDLADEAPDTATAAANLVAWRHELEECFAGRPRHPVSVALAETVRRTGVCLGPFADLLSAFEQDQRVTRYGTRAELLSYCRQSANPVGRIVLALEGCHDPGLVAMSDAICTGLQLVNFWQDIRRDRLAGRIYLPREDMVRHGVDERMLDGPTAPQEVRKLVRDEVGWAREFFDFGASLPRLGPPALRPAVEMFLGGGRSIATAIERARFDTLARRPTVGRWATWRLAGLACWRLLTAVGDPA